MNDGSENINSSELTPQTSVRIETEILNRINLYIDLLKGLEVSQAELLLDFGMIDISTESVVNSALRSFLNGVTDTFHDDPSDA